MYVDLHCLESSHNSDVYSQLLRGPYKLGDLPRPWVKSATHHYNEWVCLNLVLTLFLSTDTTLTESRLSGLVQSEDMWYLYDYLDIPGNVWESISSKADTSTAVWQWYLHNNPAPSWIHIADALYRSGGWNGVKYHLVLKSLKDQVPSLKGESRCGMYCICIMWVWVVCLL